VEGLRHKDASFPRQPECILEISCYEKEVDERREELGGRAEAQEMLRISNCTLHISRSQ